MFVVYLLVSLPFFNSQSLQMDLWHPSMQGGKTEKIEKNLEMILFWGLSVYNLS